MAGGEPDGSAGTGGIRAFLLRVVRGVLLLVGLAVFAVGALAVVSPTVAAALPMEAVIAALGSDYVVVAAVAVAAVAVATLVLLVVAISGVDEADPPIVETVESAPHPGQAVDRSVDGETGVPDARIERLTEAALRTLVRAEHCSRSTAERRVAEGTWTDDEVAADFLAVGGDGLLRTAVSDDERVRRTVEEIERLDDEATGGDPPVTPDRDEPATAAGGAEDEDGATPEAGADRTVRRRQPSPELRRESARTGGR
jgi:hypothetical protein